MREMLPWGSVEIDGTTLEAVSESGPIELGTVVEAIGVQGMGVVVRPVGPADDATPLPVASAPPTATGQSPRLSSTLEAFEFEEFQQKPS